MVVVVVKFVLFIHSFDHVMSSHSFIEGPFGFVERFDRDFICNSSDNDGRYSYLNQPAVISIVIDVVDRCLIDFL